MTQLPNSRASFKNKFPVNDRLISERIARIASNIVILIGCLVLIGWQLDLSVLKSVVPGLVTMKANTAICFLLAGISLWLQSRPTYQVLRKALTTRIAQGCTIILSMIACLTICEYLFWWNLGIDELLFSDSVALATSYPGRMGINTAVNFSLTGVALWSDCPSIFNWLCLSNTGVLSA
jgi:hypothetical protein